ncbi:MAG: hypothetical protein CK546_07735 [Pedosphaera sp.]|nr:hypothetical protein [Pedosphaera sp.]PHX94012.1 MAG: hypothetical protein CK546_07735 [Pedosphaera sp.]
MSVRIELLQVARLGAKELGDSAELVRAFYCRQWTDAGAGRDRSDRSDLYYTVFTLNGCEALEVAVPDVNLAVWLQKFGVGEGLDLVHLTSLARCWASLGKKRMPDGLAKALLARLEAFRKPDGGYDSSTSKQHGTAYGSFLALGAYQDLGKFPPRPLSIVQSLKLLETPDHAWNNAPGLPVGSTNPTAGAVTLLRHLHLPLNPAVGDWLLARLHPQGGFTAVPGAPMPDLLSTATALHALASLDRRLTAAQRERCLDFVDSLWSAEGGFHGHWADDHLDAEYTFYGLLALGHLSVQ